MPKTELNQVYKTCYRASEARPALVQVPEMNCLVISGEGHTDGPAFLEAVKVLGALAHTLKMHLRQLNPRLETTDMPLEVARMQDPESQLYSWHMLIAQPDEITPEMLQLALEEIASHFDPATLARVRLRRRSEDTCVQMLHLGAQAHVQETMAHIRSFGSARGLVLRQDAYEIYLNDPATTRPENMRTILRASVLSTR
jgi:hypothetical protein